MRVIPHSRPTISASMAPAMLRVISSGQIARGPQTERFEQQFSRKFGLTDAAAVSSGTAALHLALLALGVGKGHEVILPSYVCAALLNAVHYTGATPVIVDVEYDDGNISARSVAAKLGRKTRAIIVPHMFGEPADLFPLLGLNVPVIEDCAQAIGALYAGKPVGSFGQAAAFSFYATKMMTTGEGGMVALRGKKAMARARSLMDYDNKPRYEVRFNYKMDDIRGALGLSQLAALDFFIRRRRAIARFYTEAFKGLPVDLPVKSLLTDPVSYRYVVKVPGKADKVIRAMKAEGINAERPVFRPLHQCLGQEGCPVTERLMRTSVSLPIYPGLSFREAERIVKVLTGVLNKLKKVP